MERAHEKGDGSTKSAMRRGLELPEASGRREALSSSGISAGFISAPAVILPPLADTTTHTPLFLSLSTGEDIPNSKEQIREGGGLLGTTGQQKKGAEWEEEEEKIEGGQ